MDKRAWIVFGIVGLVAGYLASFIVGSSSWGLIGYLVSGALGAFVGGFVLNAFGFKLGIRNVFVSQIATATIGAIIVVIVARIIA
jgi:uncharacterized membrane protein YeaQ/YmgE (transglycosylase-associated protein family)